MHPRARAGLVIAAVVIASAIAGAAVDRAVVMRSMHRNEGGRRGPPSPEQEARRRGNILDRMTRDLALSASQRAGIDSILQRTDSSLRVARREMQPRLRQIFEQSHKEIDARLDSAQRVKSAALRPHGPPGERSGRPD